MSSDQIVALLAVTVVTGTPLIFAAIGELLAERSGVLNLGVEGMMLVGAVSGFAVAAVTGNPLLAPLGAKAGGGAPAGGEGGLGLTQGTGEMGPGLSLARFRNGFSAPSGKHLR